MHAGRLFQLLCGGCCGVQRSRRAKQDGDAGDAVALGALGAPARSNVSPQAGAESLAEKREAGASEAAAQPASARLLAPGEIVLEDGIYYSALPSSEVQEQMDPAVRAKHEHFMREALAQVSFTTDVETKTRADWPRPNTP